ncbi:MAG: hypothetical protein K0R24_339 [Gammaproteobacteria bacterium]|jgi:peptidoglycan hydrolase CwlO-like protein|nr:hypothetical protein [Gammaproteobacteria bacterium]
MAIENFFNNLSMKKIIVWGMSLLFGFVILRELIAFIAFHLVFNTVSHHWEDQTKEIVQLPQDTRKEMDRIQRGMNHEIEAVQQGGNEMQKKMTGLRSEFEGAEKVQKEIATAWPELLERSKEDSQQVEAETHDFKSQTKKDPEVFSPIESFKK